ncbi:nucleoside phosphorylase [Roseimarinus sediminis]|uniref:nucleoside phosphorylase n=1 Tax=Roseimarinus sediminis TaxID=1610899 RepID=UPI003D1C4B8F
MIQASELIINPDGSIFHLHLKPGQIADTILLVGDQGRVDMIASFFDEIEHEVQNREFKTVTGWYNERHLSVLSTGIGTDNIDIVVNELDALVNIDFNTRQPKDMLTSLNLLRIGTSGSLQAAIPLNSYVVSELSIGFDGLLNFYDGRDIVSDNEFEQLFMQHMQWNKKLAHPYVVSCSETLLNEIDGEEIIRGINISSPGFYGPQGRVLRLPLIDAQLNEKIASFDFIGKKITNYEMESSAIYGLSKLLGHEALTVCLIIANRPLGKANQQYHPEMKQLVKYLLDRLAEA